MEVVAKRYIHAMTAKQSLNPEEYPLRFKKVALAIAFSPRAEALLFEAVRIVKRLEAKLVLIHVGEMTSDIQKQMDELLTRSGGQELAPEIVSKVGKPVEVILEVCKDQKVELLIAGALQKENLVRYFRGSIARRLVRETSCSILLITNPKKESEPCSKVLVNGISHPKTADTVKTAIYFAAHLDANELIIADEVPANKVKVRVNDDLGLIKAEKQRRSVEQEERNRIDEALCEVCVPDEIETVKQVLYGKPGYSIGHYAADKGVDLLVMNSPDSSLGLLDRILTHDIEYVLSDLPCDLLMVHTTREMLERNKA